MSSIVHDNEKPLSPEEEDSLLKGRKNLYSPNTLSRSPQVKTITIWSHSENNLPQLGLTIAVVWWDYNQPTEDFRPS